MCVFVGPACGGCVCVLCGWNLDTFVLGGCFIYKAGRKPFSVNSGCLECPLLHYILTSENNCPVSLGDHCIQY